MNYNNNCGQYIHAGMPEHITLISTNSRTLFLSWDPPVADSRDGTLEFFSGFCSPERPEYHTTSFSSHIITAIILIDLNPFTSYNCCIKAVTTKGAGPFRCESGTTMEDGEISYSFSLCYLCLFSKQWACKWLDHVHTNKQYQLISYCLRGLWVKFNG